MVQRKPHMTAVEAMKKVVSELDRFLVQPDINGYTPHNKQYEFHKATQKGRLFLGGNRAGKTTAGVAEDIFWLRQDHPYQDLSEILTPGIPTRGRIVAVDYNVIEQVIIPEYRRWMPPSLLKDGSWDASYSREFKILTLTNGSTLDFKTYEQDMDKHSGTSRHFVHFDEEMPEHIFNENMLRLLDTGGRWWCSMTPLLGVTWLYDKYKMDEHPDEEHYIEGNVFISTVNTMDNPNLKKADIDATFEGMSEDEVKARQQGRFVEVGGLIFKTFDKKKHVIPPQIPPKTWQLYMSIDSGWKNPTAILWHAVSPDNTVITFNEIYLSETTIDVFAQMIHQYESSIGWVPYLRTGDPALKQTREATGLSGQQEYAKHGIYLSLDSVPTGPGSVSIGIQKMHQYVGNKMLPGAEEPTPVKWFITENCTNTIKEIRKLRWATYSSRTLQHSVNPQEQVHKKDDHTFDSARYFFTHLPDLKPSAPGSLNPATQRQRTWEEEMIWRAQQEAAGLLLDLSASTNNTLWHVAESYSDGLVDLTTGMN